MVCLFWSLRAVLAPPFLPVLHSAGIQNAADNLITKTDIFYSAATHHNHRVLLEIVADARHISGNFHTVGEPNPRNLSDGRVRFLRRFGGYFDANPPLKRRGGKVWPILKRIESPPKRH